MSSPRSLLRLTALLALAVACDGGGFAAPLDDASARAPGAPLASRSSGATPQGTGRPVTCDPHSPVSGRATVGRSGGVLVVGGSRLLIPRGALADTVTITGTAVGDNSSTVQFAPHGLQFKAPVQLSISVLGCHLPSGARPSVVYLGPSGEVLETIPARYLPHQKIVTAPIRHFSGYAVLF